jgi:hypothetical protein
VGNRENNAPWRQREPGLWFLIGQCLS